jgi:hypothetical protein
MLAVLAMLSLCATTFCWQCQLFPLWGTMKNARNLGLRLDQTTTDRLAAFESATKIEGVTLARAALEAALDAFQTTGKIAFPLRMEIASDDLDRSGIALLAEKPATYTAPRTKKAAG